MKASIYISILLILFLTPIGALMAEGPDIAGKGKVEGKLVEKESDTPVEYANIVIFNSTDSSLVTGGITGPGGTFELADVPYGDYYMEIRFIGYDDATVNKLILDQENKSLDLGTIEISLSSLELEGAVISAEKMAVEYKLDRKVVNVSQDIAATGASAVEVLEKVPSVRVDIDGNVLLRGSSSYTVFINGKPSVLSGSDALQNIPANTIDQIEIITNPSAKYDPDGTSGIINIKLKKSALEGISGMINATAGTGEKYGSDLYINYRKNEFNIFGGIEWNDRKFSGQGNEFRETFYNDTLDIREANTKGAFLRNGLVFKGGLDYDISEKSTISLGGEIGNAGFGMDRYRNVYDYSNPISEERYFIDDNTMRWERKYYSLNANYIQNFNGEGHTLSFLAFFSNSDGKQEQDKKEYDTDENWNLIDNDPYLTRSFEAGPSKQFRFQTDYTRGIGTNGKMETGYQFRLNGEEEDYWLENYDYDKQEWVIDDNYSKSSTFDRQIHALYGMYNNSFNGFEYQLGLRGEYTYRNIVVTNTGESSLVDRFDYFPSIHLSKKLKEKNQFSASYSRRINRPRGWFLEPFETYVDENTRRVGNPELLPEYTGSFELGYLRSLNGGNISFDAYYRKTDNKITSVQYVDPETGILYMGRENLNNDQAVGIESSFMYDITKWFNLNLSGTFYHYSVEDLTGAEGEIRTSNNWDTRVVASFKLPTNTRIQLNAAYLSPTVTAQGERESSWYSDLSIRQDFLSKKLSATFKVSDIFGTRSREYSSRGENLYIYGYRKRESQVMTLTLGYKINNYKKRAEVRGDVMDGM